MQSLSCLGMAFLQEDTGALQHDVHLMMIFMGIIMVGVVLGFLGVGVAGLMGLKLFVKVEQMAERAEGKLTPMLEKTHALVEELGPKVRTITTNVEQISYTVRAKVDEFSATASEINRTVKDANTRTQQKVARVDSMVNEALNTARRMSRKAVQESVRKPVQQVAGVIAAMKRGMETLADRMPFKRNVNTAAKESYQPYGAPVAERVVVTETYTTTETTMPQPPSASKRVTPYG